jgi:spectinomycin phosphotransferase/16S rRNA (guanine(1405)-N(7))-methyltransferase
LAAQALRSSGSDFVVAPAPSVDGEPLVRVAASFALAVYPLVVGESFGWGDFSLEHREAVLDLVTALHAAPPAVRDQALVDDYAIPLRRKVIAALGAGARDDRPGPYSRPAAELLTTHAMGVRRALARYDELVAAVRADPPDPVLTHGEPHPGNTMRVGGRWLLIDWDTVLVAPPERDLWDLDPGDGSIHAAYTAVTGRGVRADVLELYRLRWDLTDIALCLARFSAAHGETADDVETWHILRDAVVGFDS